MVVLAMLEQGCNVSAVADWCCESSNDTEFLVKRAEACVEVNTDEEVLITRNGPCGLDEVFTKHFVLRLRGIADRCVTASHMYNRSGDRQLRKE
eukprot:256777-Amphidinium_carterae.3